MSEESLYQSIRKSIYTWIDPQTLSGTSLRRYARYQKTHYSQWCSCKDCERIRINYFLIVNAFNIMIGIVRFFLIGGATFFAFLAPAVYADDFFLTILIAIVMGYIATMDIFIADQLSYRKIIRANHLKDSPCEKSKPKWNNRDIVS